MAETLRGITYPTSGDNIAPLETHFASLAGTADDAIGAVETDLALVNADLQDFKTEVGLAPLVGVFSFTGPTSSVTPVNITVTFTSGYFSAAPVVVATVAGLSTSGPYFPVIHSVTSSQFEVRVWRASGTTAETLSLNWIAK
jgi:hypothetical protein